MTRNHLRRQEGSALVTAMLVMALCLMIGFTSMALIDRQQGQSRGERERESSFALSEGALNAQIFMLSDVWPASASLQYSGRCTQATPTNRCPSPDTLKDSFTGADYDVGATWSTEIHDNAPGSGTDPDQFYSDATVRSQPGWDRNGDGLMWVRAQAVVRDRMRTLVALIRAERLDTLFPRNVLTANQLTIGPNGRQTYVATHGSYVVLRCDNGSGGQMPDAQCKGWGRPEHVGPNGTVNVVPDQRPGLSPETIERMREFAKANNTYFPNGCPDLTGEIVFLERSNCEYRGNNTFNSATTPGVLIIGSGTISFLGTTTFHGVIYHVNGSDGVGPQLSGTVLTSQGNGCIAGSVVIDGPGGVQIGASSGANKCDGNIDFNANAANNLRAYGTAGIVQNSFREIVASE